MTLFSTILIAVGKVNFTNLSRYSALNERTYRRQFEREVDFAQLNRALVEQCIDKGASTLSRDGLFVCT